MDLVFLTPRMPALGETITGSGFRQVPGGKGANQAVAAARQGAQVRFVGMVGDDAFGRAALECLKEDGIDVAGVVVSTAAPSGVAGIFVDADGSNSIVLAPGANELLAVAQVEACAAAIGGTDFLICQLETPLASVTRAIAIARERGVRVVFNPAPAQPLSDALLACVDYLIVNETEAGQLSGIEVVDPSGAVLLTMGRQGVVVAAPDTDGLVPAVRVAALDTTAAGDTFVGAFTAAMARGQTLRCAVAEAQHAAAIAVTRMGAQTSIPRREEVLALMRATDPTRSGTTTPT
jgi:ribokinase